MHEQKFEFERGRGVVWVCDIESTSKLLNHDETAIAVEEFLPRFHWIAQAVVGAAGGQFVKWTGDGFLAWFACNLHREIGKQGTAAVEAAWYLTSICNVTSLGVDSSKKFRLKHGIAVEHDALITRISDERRAAFDLIGRAVVLAFRLTGIRSQFPGIVAQKEVIDVLDLARVPKMGFKKLRVNAEDRLRYFKGERWGTGNLVASVDRQSRVKSKASAVRKAKRAISQAEGIAPINDGRYEFLLSLFQRIEEGPEWAKATKLEFSRYIRDDLLGSLKKVVQMLETDEEAVSEPSKI